ADVAAPVRAHEVERPVDPLAARVELRLGQELDERLRRRAGDAEDAARPAPAAAEGPDQADADALRLAARLELAEAGLGDGLLAPRGLLLDQQPHGRERRGGVQRLAERERDLRAPHAVTRNGKYGGASRNPIRGGRPARPVAISSAGPRPWAGTKPSCRAATASRQPATTTAPRRSSAGRHAAQ